jgi:hypothetical protein
MMLARSLTLLAALTAVVLVPSAFADPGMVNGIYCLMKAMKPVDPAVQKSSFLKGLSIRANWKELEREEGKMELSYLDDAFAQTRRVGKKAMLRILPGQHSPEWLNGKGVRFIEFTDVNKYHVTYGKPIRIPLPWDEAYLNAWVKFITQIGARYNRQDELVLVHMAGPTWHSAEMHLPRFSQESRVMLERAGYSKNNLVNAWEKVIDAFAGAFPDKSLALNLAVPFREDGAMEDIVQYARAKLGKRLCAQDNQLSDHHENSVTYKLVRTLGKQGVNIGFQMLDSARNRPDRQGSLRVSIEQGLAAGAQYFEIYQADLLQPQNRALLEELDKKLR